MNLLNFSGKHFEFDNNFYSRPVNIGQIKLYQVGELGCAGGFEFPSHTQICHEISYVMSGKGIMATDDVETEVSEGDIYVIAKGRRHMLYSDKDDPLRYAYLAFEFLDHEKDNVRNILNNFIVNNDTPKVRNRTDIDILFTSLINEFFEEGIFMSVMKEMYIQQIIVLTYRSFIDHRNRPFYLKSRNAHSVGNTVYSVIRFVDDHLYEIVNIKDIADNLGYSYGYISQLFKERTGGTLQEYVNEKKMNEASRMIKEGRLTVTKIAEKLNYETIQSFSKAFKRTFGCSPRNYAKFFV